MGSIILFRIAFFLVLWSDGLKTLLNAWAHVSTQIRESQAGAVRPFGLALCSLGNDAQGGTCPWVHLGKDVHRVEVNIEELCNQSDAQGMGYICNTTIAPACEAICKDRLILQQYVDAILSVNPFRNSTGEPLAPWFVPQTDLSLHGAYIFMSQRQALYLSLRTLGLKIRFPNSTIVSNETNRVPPGQNATIINALEYGLTYGCNWQPSDFMNDPIACAPPRGMFSGVGRAGLQGNIFALLAWARQLAVENGIRRDAKVACYISQQAEASSVSPTIWCPHDNVLGAVRGGKSGPDARKELDSDTFWKSRAGSLEDIGTFPNVCHFENSTWVWQNSVDKVSIKERDAFCKGATDTPRIYSDGISDFMSIDRPGSIAIDIAGAQYGGGRGSASGETYSTQDESTPLFYPETVALGFNSKNRTIATGATSLVFLGVRRYFSGQSGSHGYDFDGLKRPLFDHGNSCGDLKLAKLLPNNRMLNVSVLTTVGRHAMQATGIPVRMYKHSLGIVTSSCGTCMDGNLPTTNLKFRTAGSTCLVQWKDGRSGCGQMPGDGWTYWMDVWIWVGAFWPDFYPAGCKQAFHDVISRIGTGPWGAGVWWGNTLQYFIVTWLATGLLWDRARTGPQLDYYAYGAAGQKGQPLGGFCEQYQAQGYEDVVRKLPRIARALREKQRRGSTSLGELYSWLRMCSRCSSNCTFPGVGPEPANVYCTSSCTDDFLACFLHAITSNVGFIV